MIRSAVTTGGRTLLRLPGSVKEVFFHRLKEALPLRAAKIEHRIREVRDGKLYDSRFGHRHTGTGTYWDLIDMTGKLGSAMLNVQLRRLGNSDADTGTARLFEVDFHYRQIGNGSVGEIPTE